MLKNKSITQFCENLIKNETLRVVKSFKMFLSTLFIGYFLMKSLIFKSKTLIIVQLLHCIYNFVLKKTINLTKLTFLLKSLYINRNL